VGKEKKGKKKTKHKKTKINEKTEKKKTCRKSYSTFLTRFRVFVNKIIIRKKKKKNPRV
jgi:hypothetical protein